MREIIEWLEKVEGLAARVYDKAAERFKDDRDFSNFLKILGKHEKDHHSYMLKALELANGVKSPEQLIVIDENTKNLIINSFAAAEEKIKENTLTKEDILECIVTTEFSEWNESFLYVINTFKDRYGAFVRVAMDIHRHRVLIESFFENHPEYNEYRKKIRGLPKLWKAEILIVDDDSMIADILKAILDSDGNVDHAVDGEQGLERLRQKYYSAIITDIDMPKMNGMEFYRRAIENFPNIKRRFIFFTGSMNNDRMKFLKDNNAVLLTKPASIKDIRSAVLKILAG
ncbi:MAG: response regulator [Deltaproteobacteria bacterium]|nr:response regulator [Deltaproteobacteria bacterium]